MGRAGAGRHFVNSVYQFCYGGGAGYYPLWSCLDLAGIGYPGIQVCSGASYIIGTITNWFTGRWIRRQRVSNGAGGIGHGFRHFGESGQVDFFMRKL